MFNKALKSNMEENKKKDAECYGHLKIKSYGINDVFFDLTPTGFVFSVSTGEGIWPCPEVITYDHPMTFEQAAPFFILE